MNRFSTLLCGGAAAVVLAATAQAEPYARIRGVEDAELLESLYAVIGDQTSVPAGPREAHDRAVEAADRVTRALRSQGYYAARAETVQNDNPLRPTIRVRPGPLYNFSQLSIDFTAAPRPDAREAAEAAFTLSSGDPVRAEAVILAETGLVEALQERGYPDARALDREIIVDHAVRSATGAFQFDPGTFARFGELRVPDDSPVRASLVQRLAPFAPGEPVTRSELGEFSSRLRGLEGIASAEVTLGDGSGGENRAVDVQIEAGPRHVLELGGGYSTSDGAGVEGELTRHNLYRGAETLTLSARLAEIDSYAGARLDIPHWRRYGQTLTAGIRAEAERTDAYDRDALEASVSVTREITPQLAVTLGLRAESARIDEAAATVLATTSGALNIASASLGAVWDTRNDALDPSDGYRIEGVIEPAVLLDDGVSTFYKGVVQASGYHSFSDRWVLAARAAVGTILNADAGEIPADRRFYAGGGGSARGFDYQALSPVGPTGAPFGGVSLLELSTELRWRYSPRLGFAAFVDAASAGGNPDVDFGALRAGIGAGVRYYTGFGPIRLDVATPVDRRSGETPVQIYISIGQSF
ncbi:autotransporter assembly complex protein TamA [Hyphobacterium marinum]|uniref:Autotransporter assembly complex family protein n=1 Tax=Hyphobacterium marinum TaxID=3116574 RepID=A0ABU7M1L2_9PROT|nr:autotransporter assembly complex family protein [Hyphobacterium sp. Y6023]MEE2567681.1 autotransporter assembly complex family protein [Hyphobacterium sp. Y6023]